MDAGGGTLEQQLASQERPVQLSLTEGAPGGGHGANLLGVPAGVPSMGSLVPLAERTPIPVLSSSML